jgi:hypothetical protein
MNEATTQETPYADELRVLFATALAVFVITVGIGLINGQRVVTLGRSVLLTHLHTGTLGWITMMLAAVTIWLFTAGQTPSDAGRASIRRLARFAAVALALYPITFSLFYPGGPVTSPAVLAVFGTLALAAIVWLLIWTIRQASGVYLSVARLAALGALLNLTLGGLFGVLIEVLLAGIAGPPATVFTAHPGMMTVGYILPAALALIEWQLMGGIDGRRDRLGVVMVGLVVVAGWVAAIALLFGLTPLLLVMTLMHITAVILFAIRLAPRLLRVAWLAPTGERHVGVSSVAVVVDVVLIIALVMSFVQTGAPPEGGLLIALAHTEFVGIMTNAFFAALILATAARRATVWPWADHVVFWGMNVGWIGFAAVELLGAIDLIRVFTPIMGISLLIGIGAYAMRLVASSSPAPASLPSAGGE